MTRPPRAAVITLLGGIQILGGGSSHLLPAILAVPIAAEMGWSLGFVVGGLSLGLIVAGFAASSAGRSIDRHGGRPALAVGSSSLAIGLAVLALSHHLVAYLAGWVFIGLGMAGTMHEAIYATIRSLYPEQARRWISVATIYGALSSTIAWPLATLLLGPLGWRGVCVTFAALHVFVSLPLQVLLIPRRGDRLASAPEYREPPAPASSDRVRLYLAGLALTLIAGIGAIVTTHLFTILGAQGIALEDAVALAVVIGPATIASRVIELAIGHRRGPLWPLAGTAIMVAAGLLLLVPAGPFTLIGLAIYGLGNGLKLIARATVPLSLSGTSGYGAALGRLALFGRVTEAIAPLLVALVIASGHLNLVLPGLIALAFIAIAVVVALAKRMHAV